MEHKNKIQQELNELGVNIPFASMPDMQTPQGYFDVFTTSLLSEIKQQEFIESLPTAMPYQVPQGFFENFSSHLLDTIHQQKFIESLPKVMPYEVPTNYFSEFPTQILANIHRTEKTVAPLTFSRKFVAKLALAATLLLFMGIAFKGLMVSPTSIVNNVVEHQLASISDQEINQYLVEHQSEIESSLALESIDASDIDLQKLETEILDNSLNNISDEELLNYTF